MSGLPQKLIQLSMKPMLFCGHHLDINPLSDDSLHCISSPQQAERGPEHITVSEIVLASSETSLMLFLVM